ncbi:hypothetical protein M8J77_010584 [Diaphorina citri]|nr:hypothetical protein M8J77_010584 [Diaphorina citri]
MEMFPYMELFAECLWMGDRRSNLALLAFPAPLWLAANCCCNSKIVFGERKQVVLLDTGVPTHLPEHNRTPLRRS